MIIQGDCIEELKKLPEKSINMCMTSPPYWALRDYGCDNQLGLEPTFDEYINKLCNVFDEVKRVLRDDGTCWVNIGDTYAGSGGTAGQKEGTKDCGADTIKTGKVSQNKLRKTRTDCKQTDVKFSTKKKYCCNCGKQFDAMSGQYFCDGACAGVDNTPRELKGKLQAKCLLGIPMRFALEMINKGWILRNTIIWHKRNCMPSSVKDRFTVDFEYIFFFSKNKNYYFETIYEPLAQSSLSDSRLDKGREEHIGKSAKGIYGCNATVINSKGRNKRTVWTINPKPFKEAHFAVYPEELCETPIKAGCPEFVCVKCGMQKVMEYKLGEVISKGGSDSGKMAENKDSYELSATKCKSLEQKEHINLGYKPTCNCNAGFTGGIVLDPFFGAGTTGLVALKQNKKYIGIELNPKYIEIAKQRLKPFLEQQTL